ncbi:hypothetical protein [Streptomyces hirsutus]|uniref:hypothetical protein n=1 Tax=Streptomyces hirsutus TaxID=35620 RepID=UPI003F4D24FD
MGVVTWADLPRADLAQRLQDAVRARGQPRVRELPAATSTGLVADTRARFGFTAAPGTCAARKLVAADQAAYRPFAENPA